MKVGDIIGSKIKPLEAYYQKLRLNGKPKPKRLPRKLKKRIKKSTVGVQMQVISITKSSPGMHTATLKPL